MRVGSLRLQLATALAACLLTGAVLSAVLLHASWSDIANSIGGWPPATWATVAGAAAIVLLGLPWWLSSVLLSSLYRLLHTLDSMALNYRDGDFSVSIAAGHGDELAALVHRLNALGHALREQRQHTAQRELLLDTIVQQTPIAIVLSDARDRVVHANLAARQLLGQGHSLEGTDFAGLLRQAPAGLQQAVAAGEDTLFSVPIDADDEIFHVSQRSFRLQGRPHQLYMFRRMTRELSRQEVATWKRVLRVISHELNNSLAPISSMAHSGAELVRRGDLGRLAGVLATIGERAHHLHGFLEGYAQFAKLPAPRIQSVEWQPFFDGLAQQFDFHLAHAVPLTPACFDAVQMEQALINLLKNAHEAGGPPDVTLSVAVDGQECRFEVLDRGPGMTETALSQALLPFYSTKRSGSGLGLVLVREIAEAHGGRVSLSNRDGGGLRVALVVPTRPLPTDPV